MIYFIQNAAGNIKIGVTFSTIDKRVKALLKTLDDAEELIVLKTIEGGHRDEKKLHKKFAHLSIGNGWFKRDSTLLRFIEGQVSCDMDFNLFPKLDRLLLEVGENIKLARLRRKLSMQQVSERADISNPILLAVEKGNASVAIGNYLKVLHVLRLHEDMYNIALDDVLGRKLQDAGLLGKRVEKKKNQNKLK